MTRARDALAAERRRMPWLAVEKEYSSKGPRQGELARPVRRPPSADRLPRLLRARRVRLARPCLPRLLDGGRPGRPLAHLNARDTTLVFASRAPQADIARLKARMGWEMIPWYTVTDSFDADFGVGEWHGTNVFFRDGDKIFRTYFINNRGDEQMGAPGTTSTSRRSAARRCGGFSRGYPQTPTYKWWNWHDSYVEGAAPDKRWVEVSTLAKPRSADKRRARSDEPGAARRRCRRAKAGSAFTRRYQSSVPRAAVKRARRRAVALSRGRADICDHGAA
jgi:hypothetical protein